MQEWITHRLPTEEDIVATNLVIVPDNRNTGWMSKYYNDIKLGEPWAPWPKMPPYEPGPEYWSKPSDIPAEARWFLDYDGDCDMIQTVTSWGFILAQDIQIKWEQLSEWRWSERPLNCFKDGKPCVV